MLLHIHVYLIHIVWFVLHASNDILSIYHQILYIMCMYMWEFYIYMYKYHVLKSLRSSSAWCHIQKKHKFHSKMTVENHVFIEILFKETPYTTYFKTSRNSVGTSFSWGFIHLLCSSNCPLSPGTLVSCLLSSADLFFFICLLLFPRFPPPLPQSSSHFMLTDVPLLKAALILCLYPFSLLSPQIADQPLWSREGENILILVFQKNMFWPCTCRSLQLDFCWYTYLPESSDGSVPL